MVRIPETAIRHEGATARNESRVLETQALGSRLHVRTGYIERSARDSKERDPRGLSNKMRSLCQLASQCRRLMATATVRPTQQG